MTEDTSTGGFLNYTRKMEGKTFDELLQEVAASFRIEMDAKTTAYCFIAATGQLEAFKRYCRENPMTDPHSKFLEILSEMEGRMKQASR